MKPTAEFIMQPQPTGTTCGPTCLHSIYNYYKDTADLQNIIREIQTLKEGGTLASLLGAHALKRGYKGTLYSNNLHIFDPTWKKLGTKKLMEKLEKSIEFHKQSKRKLALKSHLEFLNLGGRIIFDDLSPDLIKSLLQKKKPILTGLSSTYLYNTMREYGHECIEDDIRGEPAGHFVVLYGYNSRNNQVKVADPWSKNPFSKSLLYEVPIQKLINSILLGVLTYDSNFMILTPE